MRYLETTRKNDRMARDRRAARTRSERQRRFLVEPLEDRALMTILFTPQNGFPTITDGGGRLGTVSPGLPLYTIYWGSYWFTAAGQAQQNALQNSLDTMFFFNPTLSGLNQYGNHNPAFVPSSGIVEVNDGSDPPNNFSDAQIHDVIHNAIDNLGLPEEDDFSNGGMYLVFTPPGINSGGSGSGDVGNHNSTTDFDFPFDFDTWHYAWIGNFNSQDFITNTISHEVMESMTDPDNGGLRLTNGNEICDGEAQNYAALVGGLEVASFWSAADNAYAVYDGNSATVTVDNGNLIVNADQTASVSNTVFVNLNSEGGVQVTLDGQTFSFTTDPFIQQINQITINVGSGSDTVDVLNTSVSAPVTINDNSSDTVNISPFDQNLDHIQGNVTVNNFGGTFTTLNINDQLKDLSGTNSLYSLGGSSITRTGLQCHINFTGSVAPTINGSNTAGTFYDVLDTRPFVTTNVNPGSGGSTVRVLGTTGILNITSQTADTVDVGDGRVDQIFGTVNIENPPSLSTLNIDDSNDPTGRIVTMNTFTPSGDTQFVSIAGLTPATATINYEQDDVSSPITISGGQGGNTFNVVALPTQFKTIDLNTGGGTNFINVQATTGSLVINGQSRSNTLTGPDNLAETWSISGPNQGSVGITSFSNVQNLVGGSGANVFQFSNGQFISGTISGSGTNTLDYSADINAVNVNFANSTAPGLSSFANIQDVIGGSSPSNALFGPNGNETWNITGTNAGNIAGVSFSAFGTLNGGAGNNTFHFNNGQGTIGFINGGSGGTNTLDYSAYTTPVSVNLASLTAPGIGSTFANIQAVVGGSAANTLIGPNLNDTWNITGTNAGNVAGVSFSAFANLTASTGSDTFHFSDGKGVTGLVDIGGAGPNTLDYSAYTTGVSVNLTTGTATGTGGVANIQDIIASPAVDHLTGAAGGGTTFFLAPNQGAGSTIAGSGPGNTILGANPNDVWTLSGPSAGNVNGAAFTGIQNLFGSGVNDTLIGPNANETWNITGTGSGNVAGVNFAGMSNLTGGSGNDTFHRSNGASVTGIVNGGGGTNTLDDSANTGPVTVNLATSTATGIGGIANIQTLIGGSGANTLIGPNAPETWTITGTNSGTVAGVSFSAFANLTGGTGNDTFHFNNGQGVTGVVNGGGGTDTLDYSAYTTAVQVNLASGKATGTGGFANIKALTGGPGGNALIGPNTTNTWAITGTNAGTVAGVSFSAFPNLTGGSGMDIFLLSAGKGVTGKIDGGGGGDWLDYSQYTTPVTVNLATGSATGVGGGVTNVPNVRGGQAGSTLTGNSAGNILIGGLGSDTITGGSGPSILIGGKGSGPVKGGSGDIVIGGFTIYDGSSTANDLALEAILGEWQSADSYATRIAKIKAGINGAQLVFGTTVLDDGEADRLTGGPGLNWFFQGAKDRITNLKPGEQVN